MRRPRPTPLALLWLLPLLLVLAGCGVEPRVDAIAARDIFLTPDTTSIRGFVPRHTTLDALLRAQGLAAGVVTDVIAVARTVFDPRRLRSSQPFSIERTLEGTLRLFEYEIDADSLLRITAGLGTARLRAEVLAIPKTLEHVRVAGAIGGDTPSLFQAMQATGEGPQLAIDLAEIFAGEIDFNTEVQPGDHFALAFERFTRQDREDYPPTYGVISAAEFHNDGRTVRGIRFTPPGGKPGYYDEQGRSLRRFFLRSPLKFEPRITSRFSLRRMHPVLHTARAHRGVDYGAPTGAPVVAVASGTVVSATSDRTNGRMVRVRHSSGYDSFYLHLSAFAPGIRRGVHVDQGQMIGRVGATGLATGPHLHYGLQKNGSWVDPLREHRRMPPGDPVPAAAMDAFRRVRDEALKELSDAMRELTPPDVLSASR